MHMAQKEVVKIWLTGKQYPTFTIPKDLAKECGLDKPTRAVIEKSGPGLLLRKLEI